VSGFTDPRRALDAFRAAPNEFLAIVTDMTMAELSGLDLAREAMRIRHEVPVLLTSGYLLPEEEERALRIGIRAVLGKPNFLDDLAHQLAGLGRSAAPG
jgi:CheY-like chemotaxis protein